MFTKLFSFKTEEFVDLKLSLKNEEKKFRRKKTTRKNRALKMGRIR